MTLRELETWVWYLNVAVSAILLFRLWHQRLARRYLFFFLYLSSDTAEQLLRICLRTQKSNLDASIYYCGETLKLAFAMLIVNELLALSLEGRPALARLGKIVIGVAFGVSAIAAILLQLARESHQFRYTNLRHFNDIQGVLNTTVLLALILIATSLMWFPIRLEKNSLYYLLGCCSIFLVRWAQSLLIGYWPRRTRQIDLGDLLVELACLTFWAFAFRKPEENLAVPVARWSKERMLHLNLQLDRINSRVEQLARH